MGCEMAPLSGNEAGRRLRETAMAILPLGAVEAHGPHLPVATDNYLAEAVARRVAEQVGAVLLPTLPYGQVWSLADFPGSLNISTPVLTGLLVDLGRSLRGQGVRIFALVCSHLGNMAAMKEAARQLDQEGGPLTYFFAYPGLGEVAARVCESPRFHGSFFHACEVETSMMLYLAPEHVAMERAVREVPDLPPDFDYRPAPWSEVTQSGVMGDATLATREKGEAIIEEAIRRMVVMLLAARKKMEGA